MIAVELVGQDGALLDAERTAQVQGGLREEGVLVGKMSHVLPGPESILFLSPPLILSQAEADKIVAAFEVALSKV